MIRLCVTDKPADFISHRKINSVICGLCYACDPVRLQDVVCGNNIMASDTQLFDKVGADETRCTHDQRLHVALTSRETYPSVASSASKRLILSVISFQPGSHSRNPVSQRPLAPTKCANGIASW